jgi:hypothetical protein
MQYEAFFLSKFKIMVMFMSIPLIDSLLPSQGSPERIEFDRIARLSKRGNPKIPTGEYQKSLQQAIRLGKLFLVVAQGAAESLIAKKYSSFDALVKNFGCQITALQVQQLVRKKSISEEAQIIADLAEVQIKRLSEYLGKSCPVGELNLDFRSYLCDRANVGIEISPEMAQLIRFRFLCIINDNQPVEIESEGVSEYKLSEIKKSRVVNSKITSKFEEQPITKIESLLTEGRGKHLDRKYLSPIVSCLQAEESVSAANFISEVAVTLFKQEGTLRLEQLVSGLDVNSRRESRSYNNNSSIVSVPLLYNTEAAIRGIVGILLIKNKVKFCGKPIVDAVPLKIYLKMPEQRVLEEEEIKALPKEEPLYVMEGYVKQEALLVESVARKEFIALLNAQIARIPQYASNTKRDDLSPTLKQSLQEFGAMENTNTIFSVDHMYCASVEEELS